MRRLGITTWILLEALALCDTRILSYLKKEVSRTFQWELLYGYQFATYLLFGVGVAILAKWLGQEKSMVSLALACLNGLIFMRLGATVFGTPILGLILLGVCLFSLLHGFYRERKDGQKGDSSQ